MGAGRAGTVIEIAGPRVFVVMMCVAVMVVPGVLMRMIVCVLTGMHVFMHMRAAIGVDMAVTVRPGRFCLMLVGVIMMMLVSMAMDRTVGMNMGMFVTIAFHAGLARRASANCAHDLVS
jgi:hypothetical protein